MKLTRIFSTLALLSAIAVGPTASAQNKETIRQYQFAKSQNGYELVLKSVPKPQIEPHEVLVEVRAVSLNRRDIYILGNDYGRSEDVSGAVPLSDGAGKVIAVGSSVTQFEVGDRVAGAFFSDWAGGPRTAEGLATVRGSGQGGMLSEMIVSPENGLISIPDHLSYEEASTLPCAALTAWVGLFKHGNLQSSEYVLLEGTGGVSSFGLVFAVAAGAKPIITSSSNGKLAKARDLGAIGTVNYREHDDWHVKVRELTSGAGVNHVLEIGGRNTVGKAIQTLAFDGHMALIGGLSGFGASIPVPGLMRVGASATGVYVGSRADFEQMNAFISEHKVRPVIDRVFSFEDAREAYDHMQNGSFMGKIVISF